VDGLPAGIQSGNTRRRQYDVFFLAVLSEQLQQSSLPRTGFTGDKSVRSTLFQYLPNVFVFRGYNGFIYALLCQCFIFLRRKVRCFL
jgi:hypothetical protein